MNDKMYEMLRKRINKLEKSNEKINEKLDLIIQCINDLYDDDEDDEDDDDCDDCDDEDEHGWDWVKDFQYHFID